MRTSLTPAKPAVGQRIDWGGWYLVGVIVIALLLSYIDRAIVSLVGPQIQVTLSLTDTQMSLLYGIAFVAPLAIGSVLVGWAVDRFNRVLIILFGVVLWSTMTAGCGLVSSYMALLIVRGGIGAGESALVPAAYAMIADRFPPEKRGKATGIVSIAVSVGTGSALLVGGFILDVLDRTGGILPLPMELLPWQETFVILGLLGIPVAILVFTLKDRRPSSDSGSDSVEYAGEHWQFVRRHRAAFAIVLGTGAINVIVGTGVVAWSPTLFARRFEMSGAEIGYILGTMTVVGGLIGAPLMATLSDRWVAKSLSGGRLRGHPLMFALLLLGVALLTLSSLPAMASFGIVFVQIALGGINAISYVAIQDLSPSTIRGRMLAALQFTSLTCGYALGPSVVALVTDAVYGDQTLLHLSLLSVAFVLCCVGGLVTVIARPIYERAQAERNGIAE